LQKNVLRVCCGKGGKYNYSPPFNCNVNVALCPNPKQYFNWDGIHLTETSYRAIAHMLINGRKYSWNNEIKVKKSSNLSNKRKYAWNNRIGDEERALVLLEDEYEPGQIKESPKEEEPLRNIAASCWAGDDENFDSPNPKRVKVS
ncbi:hypothetical protein KI387_032727, partial [Taxus chinensis]